ETLLLSWILVPALFFQLWPVKGFQYLLPTAPAFAVLAGRALAAAPKQVRRVPVRVPLVALVALSLALATWQRIATPPSATFLAGSGGVPGGRELGRWIDGDVPQGATFLAVGPSMANIVQFYGHRRAYGLSVGT